MFDVDGNVMKDESKKGKKFWSISRYGLIYKVQPTTYIPQHLITRDDRVQKLKIPDDSGLPRIDRPILSLPRSWLVLLSGVCPADSHIGPPRRRRAAAGEASAYHGAGYKISLQTMADSKNG